MSGGRWGSWWAVLFWTWGPVGPWAPGHEVTCGWTSGMEECLVASSRAVFFLPLPQPGGELYVECLFSICP